MLVARRAGINHATDALAADTGNDQATRDTLTIATRLLQDMSRAVVALGILAIAGAWSLGPDACFVLSDNLALGTDSRHTGPVRRADILGRAWLVYAPRVRRITQ